MLEWGLSQNRNKGWRSEGAKINTKEIRSWDLREVICFRCREKGRIARYYNKRGGSEGDHVSPHEEQMDCSFEKHKGPWWKAKPLLEIKIGHIIVPAIVGTGCTQTMPRSDLVAPKTGELTTPVNMVYISGASYTS